VLVTDGEGRPVERYEYSPFGERWIFVDSTPPRIEQVLAVGQEIRLELSEEVDLERLRAALGTGVTLRSQVTAGYFDLTIEQPVTEGREAGRRLVLRPADPGSWPAANEAVELILAPGLLADHFDNVDGAGFTQSFPWPATARVVEDTTPPRVTELCVEPSGRLKLTFSETPRLADLQRITRVDGATLAWTLAEDGYTVLSNAPLAAGSHSLTILGEEPLDLAELALAAEFRRDFEVVSGAGQLVFQAPHAGQVDESTLLNVFGFHGLPRDPETGFLYARNRYYDPTMGRFVSTDPMGYVDGPNSYQFALNNPAVYSDPMGLCVLGLRCRDLPGFYWDYLKGVTSDLGGMALGLADLATLGTISDARTSLATFREAEGSLIDRYAAARIAGLKARMNTVTLGFSGAEDKTDHLKTLIGFKQLEQAGTLLGTAVANGDWEMGLEGVGKLLEGAGALAGTVSLAAGPAAKAGIIPRPGMAAAGARGGQLQISASATTGNPAAISRGLGKLSSRQARLLEMLTGEGSSTILPKRAVRLKDLAALTAETGDEFAMFTRGSQRMIMRGSSGSVPVTPEIASQMAGRGWRWSGHTHPGTGQQVLRSSIGDRAVLSAFGRGRSVVYNSVGQHSLFGPNGDLLLGWRPW
jgi:RHS repeat-associated protein